MTVCGEDLDKVVFVLENITSVEPVSEDWDLIEDNKSWWAIGFRRVVTGYRFKINLGGDFLYLRSGTEEKAKELRVELIKKMAAGTALNRLRLD